MKDLNLGDLGEDNLIDLIASDFGEEGYLGPGADDCGVYESKAGGYRVTTMDGTHPNPISAKYGLLDNENLGRYLVMKNVSDLISTGAEPEAFTSYIGLPADAEVYDFEELIHGIREESNKYDMKWIGGDLNEREDTVLVGTAEGYAANEQQLRTRGGAMSGDKLLVTGDLGDFTAAAYALEKNVSVSARELKNFEDALMRPEAPLEASRYLSDRNMGNGGIDISDGLGKDIWKMAEASSIGVRLYEEKIPTSEFVDRIGDITGISPAAFAFPMGGDLQSLITLPEESFVEIEKDLESLGVEYIGDITDGDEMDYIREGEPDIVSIPKEGTEAFTPGSMMDQVEEILSEHEDRDISDRKTLAES